MKLIFVTSCKPMNTRDIEIIQKNSIESWKHLNCEKEIYVFNKDKKIVELCGNLGVNIVNDYEHSDKNDIPTWRTMRNYAAKVANDDDVIIWVNCDVMFNETLVETIIAIKNYTNNFVLVGQKYDWYNFYELTENKDFSELGETVKHSEWAIDYFIFQKDKFDNVPGFFIARQRFDNYLMTKSISDYQAIDCTNTIHCIHHRHNYGPDNQSNFSEIYHLDYWQNEQKVNDSLINVKLSNIKDCLFQTITNNNKEILIVKK